MFSGCLQDFSRIFSRCSDGSCGIWWSFQMKVWTLKIQRNPMIPNYSMIPAICWSPAIWWSRAIRWSPVIRWSIGSMDFDNPKVYGDTFISDGLVFHLMRCGFTGREEGKGSSLIESHSRHRRWRASCAFRNKKDEGKRNFLLHMSARDRESAENKEEAIWSGLKDKNLDILTDLYRVL